MDPDASPPIPAPQRPARPQAASPRLRIAQLAAEAAIAVPGVQQLQGGALGLHMTSGAGERVDGVVVAALDEERYEVNLHLVCGLVALPPLAESVRAAVLGAAAAVGLAEAVGPVNVHIEAITA